MDYKGDLCLNKVLEFSLYDFQVSDKQQFLFQLKSAAELKTEHDSGAVPEKEYFTRLQKLIVPKVSQLLFLHADHRTIVS